MFVYAISFILHLDLHLQSFFLHYGAWIYALIGVIIFLESGCILTPFLPGDSLLFATGSLIALSALNIHWMVGVAILAAITGASLNYSLGAWIGPKIFSKPKTRWLNPQHLTEAHAFFERYGWGAIIVTRFIPILRTFVPFVAGIGRMPFRSFLVVNTLAALIWVGGILYLSYAFGQLPWIKGHFSAIVLGIMLVSILPAVFTFIKARRGKANAVD